jgi:hypothetical protein
MDMKLMWLAVTVAFGVAVRAAVAVAAAADASAAVESAHQTLWGRFVGPDGVIRDYVGDLPTPEDCAQGRPNAIGWWSPIENGPMFTGLYLPAACERARRSGKAEDKEQARRLAEGLMRCASVSDVPGMIVRGMGSDGRCHYPLGSDDQTHPWFYGLHAYVKSGLPGEAERARILAKMREVADVLESTGWRCPCDGAFAGDFRGGYKGHLFRDAVRYLHMLRAMADVTGDAVWLQRYRAALAEKPAKSDKTRAEICAVGYPLDREAITNIDGWSLWIYVGSQGALAALAAMERDESLLSLYRAGLLANATNALPSVSAYKQFDNADRKVFGNARWREAYTEWFPQKTQEDAKRASETGNKAVLGARKRYEAQFMRNPLAAAAVVALAGGDLGRAEIAAALAHYDYSKLNMAELFFAECAYYARPEARAPQQVGCARHLFLDDRLVDRALTRGVARTVNPPRDVRRVLAPDRPWEALGFIFYSSVVEDAGGVKLYYGSYTLDEGKLQRHFCLATSRDGVAFERPVLGQRTFAGSRENNLLALTAVEASVFLDPHAAAGARYRLIYSAFGLESAEKSGVYSATSPDGVAWTASGVRLLPFVPDSQHTAYWDERLQRYAVFMRCWDPALKKRQVCRAEVAELDQPWPYDPVSPPYQPWGKEKIPTLSREYPVALAADADDPKNVDIYTNVVTPYPEAADAFLAFPAAYFKYVGPEWKGRALSANDGTFEAQLATSADGVTWTRLRQPYLAPGCYDGVDLRLVSLARGYVRRGRWLYQYFVGWPHTHGRPNTWERDPAAAAEWMRRERGGLFLARQRVDGFVSLDGAYEGGVLTTKPLAFAGNRLRLNLDTRGAGCARVALLDEGGAPLPGYALEQCEAINGDEVDCEVRWAGGADVGALAGRPVRVQAELRNAKLYALQFAKAG